MLAEIPPPPTGSGGAGSLRRGQVDAYARLLDRLGTATVVNVTGGSAKSPVATGLATAAVVASRRALLLEADLAGPTLAASLGLAAAPGLADYLRAEADASEILQSLILAGPLARSSADYLVCVVAGRPTSEGAALLGSERFRHAVARLRSAYELVVIDGPPDHSDSSLLAVSAQADMTLACCTSVEAKDRRWAGVGGLVLTG